MIGCNFAPKKTVTEKSMQKKYDEIMKSVEERMSAIDLNGKEIVSECKSTILFLREKLKELKNFVELGCLRNEDDEIDFFKNKKPVLYGRLLYFKKVLRIESQCPLCDPDTYYRKRQEELKLFFDRHVTFYQYFRSGATYLDRHYFTRAGSNEEIDMGLSHWDDDSEFTTGYDNLAARIIAMEMLYAYVTNKKRLLQHEQIDTPVTLCREYRWTDTKAAAVELIYAIHESGSVNNGKAEIKELVELFEVAMNIDLSNVYNIFVSLKNRKNNRSVYLDAIKDSFLKRLNEEDCK